MSSPVYLIRNYCSEDFSKLVQLEAEVKKLEQPCCSASPQDLSESLGRPNHFPENNLFVAEVAGGIVGYVDVTPELNIGRVVLSCLAYPEHCRKGLGTKFLDCAIHRSQELGVKIVHVNIPQDSVIAIRLLTKMGFRFARRFLELRLDLSETPLPNMNQTVPECHHVRRGEEDKLTQIQNCSFADTWGYNPNSVEEIIYRANLPNCSPEDIILACDADKPIGYCWTRTSLEENAAPGKGKGRICMLGVDPAYRGRGTGKQVLLAGLFYLKSKGLRLVELTVDGENKPACALYKSLGFKISTSSLWYEKVLD